MENAYTDKRIIKLVNKCKRLREENIMSQTLLAHNSGVDKQYIQQFEQYKFNPGYLMLCGISESFNMTVCEFIKCENEPDYEIPTPIIKSNALKINI